MRSLPIVACSLLFTACAATSTPIAVPSEPTRAESTRTIRCRWIEIVDASDRVVIRLGTDSKGHPRIAILDEEGWPAISLGLMDAVDDEGRKTGAGASVHLETGEGIVTLATSDVAAGLVVTKDEVSSFTVTAGEALSIEKLGEKP